MSEYKLAEEIVKLSISKKWDIAKLEWGLNDVYVDEEQNTCLCGHFPIIEMCVLKNKVNGELATVGNYCVKKFLGLPSDKIFQAVKRVRKDKKKSLNAETITHAFDRKWINEWERDFYLDIMRKRSLTDKQAQKKLQVNERVLIGMRRNAVPKNAPP
ncbi:MAG: hypothetical protein HGA87_02225 [Desulfobulbaceae bacterium]|nr:hypothetical protein [Desulfobulbaceae bacterium]